MIPDWHWTAKLAVSSLGPVAVAEMAWAILVRHRPSFLAITFEMLPLTLLCIALGLDMLMNSAPASRRWMSTGAHRAHGWDG
jgi:hypothetical protein